MTSDFKNIGKARETYKKMISKGEEAFAHLSEEDSEGVSEHWCVTLGSFGVQFFNSEENAREWLRKVSHTGLGCSCESCKFETEEEIRRQDLRAFE